MNPILAIGWDPEIRGILTVIIAVVTLCGSVYMIMATNIGARLGFLVALAGLAGWMFLMGIVWMIYGIGLQGRPAAWDSVPGRTVLQDPNALYLGEVFENRVEIPEDADFVEQAALVEDEFVTEGWKTLAEEDPAFGQAGAAAEEFLVETGTFAAGEYRVMNVFDIGGGRWPKIGDSLDFIAFRHDPHYVVVEVAALEPVRTEPGRAPAADVVDDTRQRQYVYMVRDLGTRRQPAAVLTVGGGLIFFILCWLLHRRERFVQANRNAVAVPAG